MALGPVAPGERPASNMSDGPPMMVAPLGADHPPGGCPHQPWPVVQNDRPLRKCRGKGATTCMEGHGSEV